jgi:hypothetical protein
MRRLRRAGPVGAALVAGCVLAAAGCGGRAGADLAVGGIAWQCEGKSLDCTVSFDVRNTLDKPVTRTLVVKPYWVPPAARKDDPTPRVEAALARREVKLQLGPNESRCVSETIRLAIEPAARRTVRVTGVRVDPL